MQCHRYYAGSLVMDITTSTSSLLIRKSQLQTLCLLVLLLPLPLLYLLHVQMTREHRHNSELHGLNTLETQFYPSHNTSLSLQSAAVQRILVRETRRVKTSRTNSVYAGIRQKCRSRICREYLSKKDLAHFSYCWKKARMTRERERSQCRFLNATTRPPIALASFPGSGNTWVRGLLQQATGICTGGIYCDTTLRISGYPGESLRSGATLVVKTHQIDPRWTGVFYPPNTTDNYFTKEVNIPVYDAAIFIIRNPFHALVAEWNHLMTINMTDNHIITVDAKYFLDNSEWDEYVHNNAIIWQETVIGWLIKNHNHRVMVVKYEDLKRKVNSEVMLMLDFLEFPYKISAVGRRLNRGYDEFRRKHSSTSLFEHFTPEQKQFVKSVLHTTILELDYHNLTHTCDIRDYLTHI